MYRLCCLFLSLYVSVGLAATYQIPTDSRTVGEMKVVTAVRGDTLNKIAVRYGVGYNEIVRANPKLSKRRLKTGTQVIVPTAYVLPNIDHQGIVINLSAMRLYYFLDDSTVMTYPVAIGKRGWGTPKANTTIVKKHRHPTWTPPASIIREAARKGKKLRRVYPAGPNNPLGTRALRLGLPGYLIHGTNKPASIGKRRSHGCIRMRRGDVEELFDKVSVGTSVRIISQASPLAELPELPEQAMIAEVEPEPQPIKKQVYRKKRKAKSKYRATPINKKVRLEENTDESLEFYRFLAQMEKDKSEQQTASTDLSDLPKPIDLSDTPINSKAPAILSKPQPKKKHSNGAPPLLTPPEDNGLPSTGKVDSNGAVILDTSFFISPVGSENQATNNSKTAPSNVRVINDLSEL